jgi:pimeloyl-ACP methyl ester carboxylesterase
MYQYRTLSSYLGREVLMIRRPILSALLLAVALPALVRAEGDALRRQAYLGAALAPPSGPQAGARVVRVTAGTAAAEAGLKAGDRVLKIGGRLLDDPVEFSRVYAALRGGDTVDLEVLRDGAVFTRRIALPPLPKEQLAGLEVEYGSVLTARGHRLRTIVTRPRGATGRLPGIVLAGWLSCDPVEWPLGANAGHAKLIQGIARDSGFVLMRVDKPGVGDSEGPACADADFAVELAGYRAAFQALERHPAVDPDRIFVLGISNGGGIAPLVAPDAKVRGYVVSGGWLKTWFEHMLENERRRLTLSGSTPAEVNDRMRGYAEFYTHYLEERMTPREVLRRHPQLAPLWYDLPEHQFGRPAAFYQQLQALNLAEAWNRVNAPVLVIYGEHDWIMSREDNEMIAAVVNRNHPGTAQFVAVPRMDHLFHVNTSLQKSFDDYDSGTFDPALVTRIVHWMKERL